MHTKNIPTDSKTSQTPNILGCTMRSRTRLFWGACMAYRLSIHIWLQDQTAALSFSFQVVHFGSDVNHHFILWLPLFPLAWNYRLRETWCLTGPTYTIFAIFPPASEYTNVITIVLGAISFTALSGTHRVGSLATAVRYGSGVWHDHAPFLSWHCPQNKLLLLSALPDCLTFNH